MNRALVTACCLILTSAVTPLWAGSDNVIVIGNTEVLRIRADASGFTARQRADALRKRILEIYQTLGQHDRHLRPEDVTLDLTPGKTAIRVQGLLLLSVTPEDARVNGHTTVADLARVWHARLRDALLNNAPLPGNTQYPKPSNNVPTPR